MVVTLIGLRTLEGEEGKLKTITVSRGETCKTTL